MNIMINAVDARELQQKGLSDAQKFQQALERCCNAIADVARNRQEGHVDVVVFRLSEKSLEELKDEFLSRGFLVKADYRNDKQSVLSISWTLS